MNLLSGIVDYRCRASVYNDKSISPSDIMKAFKCFTSADNNTPSFSIIDYTNTYTTALKYDIVKSKYYCMLANRDFLYALQINPVLGPYEIIIHGDYEVPICHGGESNDDGKYAFSTIAPATRAQLQGPEKFTKYRKYMKDDWIYHGNQVCIMFKDSAKVEAVLSLIQQYHGMKFDGIVVDAKNDNIAINIMLFQHNVIVKMDAAKTTPKTDLTPLTYR